ncbi:MAG: cation diffusion facilitator family transporter [Candidatus Eremiobacteraeota bacterium]|nr:cation diffusion facilitator family transporter [Candidatus Eremiobacteraeota bacterium]
MERARLRLALALTAFIALVELLGGWYAHSLALFSDAAHVCMDVFALAIALAAAAGAQRPANRRKTFGYGRVEILAALGNAGLLFAVTVLIAVEAMHRLRTPQLPDGALMSGVAAVGLIINAAIGMMLFRTSRKNLNVKAALYHVASDALGAAAVVIGGIVIFAYKVGWLDPILSLFVCGIIVLGVLRITRQASDVLLESVPAHLDVHNVLDAMRTMDGVVGVHDLHVWSIGTQSCALSAHILLNDRQISEASSLLRRVDDRMRSEFGISHVTIQFECETCEPDERIICTQLSARQPE